MTDAGRSIADSSDAFEQPADRLLRRILGWAAIVYGGGALVGTALHVGLARTWLASPDTMSWTLRGGWDGVLLAAGALTMAGLVLGGVLLLRRRARASIPILRASVACSFVVTVLGLAMTLHESDVYASYWSTPATAVVEGMHVLQSEWLPMLIVLLTLPPLARRMGW